MRENERKKKRWGGVGEGMKMKGGGKVEWGAREKNRLGGGGSWREKSRRVWRQVGMKG